jgi:hypothetical protein
MASTAINADKMFQTIKDEIANLDQYVKANKENLHVINPSGNDPWLLPP